MSAVSEQMPTSAPENERDALAQLQALLHGQAPLKLVGPDGAEIALPATAYILLERMVGELAQGHAVCIVPTPDTLTTQQAADLLAVSRPYLIKLLESGAIPFSKVGTHRRILFADVMRYKRRRDHEERAALDELAQLSQDMGLY